MSNGSDSLFLTIKRLTFIIIILNDALFWHKLLTDCSYKNDRMRKYVIIDLIV